MAIFFDRRVNGKTISSENPADIWPNWKGKGERWLFMSPHDDDIVCGCGLTFISAIASGIETFAGVVTQGNMGYCRPEMRETIAAVRQEECTESFRQMGLSRERLFFLNHDDGSLNLQAGRRFSPKKGPAVIAGATGLQNSFTWLLRQTKPTRVFIPSLTDLHPDHKFTNSEMMISIFHAQGGIWPELGAVIDEIPLLYEYATYSNLPRTRRCAFAFRRKCWRKNSTPSMPTKVRSRSN